MESIDIIDEYLIKRDYTGIIYLDFAKTFDKISHDCLRVKMKNLAISYKIEKYIFLTEQWK